MNEWASRRKNIYTAIIVVFLTSISLFVFWKFWYKAPTCFDGVKNGNELGIDCGGSCDMVCRADTLKPIVRWDPRIFEISPNVWSSVVYVENPNANVEAVRAPYTFSFYDEKNELIALREGVTFLPKSKTVGIFEGEIIMEGGARPRRAIFEISNDIEWRRNSEEEAKITVTHTPLLRLDTKPRIETIVKNDGTNMLENIELVATIFDGRDNVIAASRSFVERLDKNSSSQVVFTWGRPFDLGSRVCEKPSNIALLIDRSGSMVSLGGTPPEPITTAKAAAQSFIDKLLPVDRVSVVSFATSASEPVDQSLTSDFFRAKEAVSRVAIATSSTQYTNIFDAVRSGWQALVAAPDREGVANIEIILTDGVATHPKNPTGKTEADDIAYAENEALRQASLAKQNGVIIYTIGLGKNINDQFLKQLASDDKKYFFAPTADDLQAIYSEISSDICVEVPARIEITYKIFGDLL